MTSETTKQKTFPILIENSRIPVWAAKLFKMNTVALSFFVFIISKDKITPRIWQHEMIHYEQQKELWFVGQWILYAYYSIKGRLKYKNNLEAYRSNPFEKEARTYEKTPDYLLKRRKFAWMGFRG